MTPLALRRRPMGSPTRSPLLVCAVGACLLGPAPPLPAGAQAVAGAADPSLEPARLLGDSAAIGDGTIRTWLELDPEGAPLALGVTLPERTFPALDDEGFMLSLDLPAREGLPFRHVLFDWVPHGHPPAPLYGHAHWDAHFYTISARARREIQPGPVDERPEARYMPDGFVPVPALGLHAFAEMGVHWVSIDAPELNGKTFEQTLIYGSIGDRTIFVEPMFTMAYLRTHPDLVAPVPWPRAVPESGYYPTRYVIRYVAEEGAFRIALEGFEWRDAGP